MTQIKTGDIKRFDLRWWKSDLLAGIVVGVMLVPQGMAYAMLAGVHPIHGLYAAVLPLLLYSFIGTSRLLSVGPVAIASLLTAAGLHHLAVPETTSYLLLATTLALMVGLLQLGFGIFRLGFLVNFLSMPIVLGYMHAVAILITISQLKHWLGIDMESSNDIFSVFQEIVSRMSEVNTYALGIGIGGLLVMVLLKRISKTIPGSLLALVLSIIAVKMLDLERVGVPIIGHISLDFSQFQWPSLQWETLRSLFPTALTVALVSFLESSTISKSLQFRHKDYRVWPNRELIALGMANLGASLSQAFPVSGSFSRSGLNDQSGAKTQWTGIVAAMIVVLTLVFMTPLFYHMPRAILASIIISSVFGLVDGIKVKRLWHTNREDFALLFVTFIITLIVGVQAGILAGIIISLAVVIYHSTKPHYAILGRLPNTSSFRNIERFEEAVEIPSKLIIRFDAQLYFANVNFFRQQIEKLVFARKKDLQEIVLDFGSINRIDSTACYMLQELYAWCKQRGIKISFVTVKGPIRDVFRKTGLFDTVGVQNFYLNLEDCITDEDCVLSTNNTYVKRTLQSNEQ